MYFYNEKDTHWFSFFNGNFQKYKDPSSHMQQQQHFFYQLQPFPPSSAIYIAAAAAAQIRGVYEYV